MQQLQAAKATVLRHNSACDAADAANLLDSMRLSLDAGCLWRGLHPFHEQQGPEAIYSVFWQPFRQAFVHLQRRADVFLAGLNDIDDGASVWTCEMGHFMGLFDEPWLDIPPTGRMAFIRFAEFHRVVDERIVESALFFDLLGVMRQAGVYPLPPQTGASFLYPGPQTHDGILLDANNAAEGEKTMNLVNSMVADLSAANKHAEKTGDNRVPPESLARSWHNDMIWYGPEGIGATYTIERYQHQHQFPFRFNLEGKTFNGHVARFAEGNYACFFGWPNLTNTASGGFLGLTGGGTPADMRVVDVYRRDGDKLAENWVIIDLPHWLNMQGLDVLERMRQLNGLATFR